MQEEVKCLKETIEQLESVRQKQKFEFMTLQNKASQMASSLKGLARNISAYIEENKLLKKKLNAVEKRHNMGFHDMTPRPNYREIFQRRGFQHFKENFSLRVMQQHYSSSEIIEELVDHIKGLESKQYIVNKQTVENLPPKQPKPKTGGSKFNDISLSVDMQGNPNMLKSFRMSKKRAENMLSNMNPSEQSFKGGNSQINESMAVSNKRNQASKPSETNLSAKGGNKMLSFHQPEPNSDPNMIGTRSLTKPRIGQLGSLEKINDDVPPLEMGRSKSTRFDTVLNKLGAKRAAAEPVKDNKQENSGQKLPKSSSLIKLNLVSHEVPSPLGTSVGLDANNSEIKSPDSHNRRGFGRLSRHNIEGSDSRESLMANNHDNSNDSGVSKLSDENYQFIRALEKDMHGINQGFDRLLKIG